MQKTILLTGATDGIGLACAKSLAAAGHELILHGRNPNKLQSALAELSDIDNNATLHSVQADLSSLSDTQHMIDELLAKNINLDVLINNAGVLKLSEPTTPEGLDARFVVNAIAPFMLTQRLQPLFKAQSRVVNVSSAAQMPVNFDALDGQVKIQDDFTAYAQSKLAITMWSRHLATMQSATSPAIIAVNPGSMLGSKMVQDGFGVAGGDIAIGADILCRAALSDEFAAANGRYYDNDNRQFNDPHSDALSAAKNQQVSAAIERIITNKLS